MYAPREKKAIFFWNPTYSGFTFSDTLNDSYKGGGLVLFFFLIGINMLKCLKYVKSFVENDGFSTGLMGNLKLVTERSLPGEEKEREKGVRSPWTQVSPAEIQLSFLVSSLLPRSGLSLLEGHIQSERTYFYPQSKKALYYVCVCLHHPHTKNRVGKTLTHFVKFWNNCS